MPEPYRSAKGYAVLTFPPATPQDRPHVVVIAVHATELEVNYHADYAECNHIECYPLVGCKYQPKKETKGYTMSGAWTQYFIIDPDSVPEMPEELRALTDGADVDSMPT